MKPFTMKVFCLFLSAFSLFAIRAQADDKLQAGIEQLQAGVKTVSTEKVTYNQEFTANGDQMYIVQLKQEEVGAKGKSTQTIFDFNLADIDVNLISRLVSGNVMYVNLKAKNQQKLFRETVNGVHNGYSNEIKIFVNNVDEARQIIDNLKMVVPIANDLMKKRLNLTDYNEMLNWLKANITNVNKGTSSVEQRFDFFPEIAGKVAIYGVETNGSKSKTITSTFNLADITSNLVFFEVKGKDVLVSLPTVRNNKLIKVSENGQPASYDKEMTIYAAGIDQARDLATVLKAIIEKANEVVTAALPKTSSSVPAIIDDMNTSVAKIDLGTTQISQTFTPDCVSELVIITSTAKSSKEEHYAFSFRDLNPALLDYKVRSNVMEINFQTLAGQKLVKVIKDGQLQSYTDEFSLSVNDPEDARSTVYRLKKIIQLCNDQYKSPVPSGDMKTITGWLTANIVDVNSDETTLNQRFTNPDGDDIRFEVTTSGTKTSDVEVFEFNLCDIDANLVNFSISGKNLFVKIETRYKQKIIKAYKNGKNQSFTSDLKIRVNDVEAARNIIEAIKAAVQKCK